MPTPITRTNVVKTSSSNQSSPAILFGSFSLLSTNQHPPARLCSLTFLSARGSPIILSFLSSHLLWVCLFCFLCSSASDLPPTSESPNSSSSSSTCNDQTSHLDVYQEEPHSPLPLPLELSILDNNNNMAIPSDMTADFHNSWEVLPAPNRLLLNEVQVLGLVLEAFGRAHDMGPGWATQYLLYLTNAGVSSVSDLATGCKEETINLDLELFGVPRHNQLSAKTLALLKSFLPGPIGLRCFRVAQMAATKVRKGDADTEYVHRSESGKVGAEKWKLPVGGDDWILHVDCAGFVRNCLKHVTKNPFVMTLSDRDFMRAKDFYAFFSSMTHTILDDTELPSDMKATMKWRLVPDLRMVIPGDIIVYRPEGNNAGGAAFTENDRKDLRRVLKAVKTAQLWAAQAAVTPLTARNFAKDPTVKVWVDAVKAKLNAVGINTVQELRNQFDHVNELLAAKDYSKLTQDTLNLIQECIMTTAQNTGHIVFASGPAVKVGDDEYRIRVVHSTKHGKKDSQGQVTTGVQEHYRRFRMAVRPDGSKFWTRNMIQTPVPGVEDDNPNDDMEDDDQQGGEEETEENAAAEGDELAGLLNVEVLAARMNF